MINKDFNIAALIAKHISGEINEDETLLLNRWRKEKTSNEDLFQRLCNSEHQKTYFEESNSYDSITGWNILNQKIDNQNRRYRIRKVLSYAAAILLPVLFVGSSLFFTSDNQSEIPSQFYLSHSILPGEAKAILTLGSGEVVNITSQKDLADNHSSFLQQDSSTLCFNTAQTLLAQAEIPLHKIEIPRGGEYKLVLSDGTRVHLNSMSSLRFPGTFTADAREVELDGEAYFDVTPGNTPFIVNARGLKVEVLGTSFNISAYPDEDLETTLVTGSVKLSTDNGESFMLKPSQQAILSSDHNEMNIRTIDTYTYTSWVNGLIHFKDERLEDIMRTLSRWYDIDVVYTSQNLKNLRFGCHIDKYDEITPFLKLLEETEKMKIKIDGHQISFGN